MLMRNEFQKMKHNEEKITMMTAYDYPSAKLTEEAGMDMILVGDSLGMVVLGYDSTVQVTLDDMIHHSKAVKRGAPDTFMAVDMPFMTYHISQEDALRNAFKLFQETNAQALKIEGGTPEINAFTTKLTEAGIPVIIHLGLTPQSVNVFGGYKVQGRDETSAERIKREAIEAEQAGAMMLVLECIPQQLAKEISEQVSIPTIGIGSGLYCDGQVLVYHDMLQYGVKRLAKFVKPYGDLNAVTTKALKHFSDEVKKGTFPTEAHAYL